MLASEPRVIRENQIVFDWHIHYKESIIGILQHEVWKYGVWCIYPTITCAYSWIMGYAPQAYLALKLPNDWLIGFGRDLFRAQHIFFELFYPLKIFSVPLGLIVGTVVFVAVYALIITLIKEEIYCGFQTRRVRKILSVGKLVIVIAVIIVVLYIMGNFRPSL